MEYFQERKYFKTWDKNPFLYRPGKYAMKATKKYRISEERNYRILITPKSLYRQHS